jgi:transcription elongation factor GreA
VAAQVGGNEWHDNFSFEQCERDERMLHWRIDELRSCLVHGIIVDPPTDTTSVQIGSTVEVEFEDRRVATITIGGHLDSDPDAGIVAYDTPLGASLIDAEVGEERTYAAGRQRRVVLIRSIRSQR